MSDNPTRWCCAGRAAECPLCTAWYGTRVDTPCPGHPANENNQETVDTARLHAERRHPGYEYRTTEGPRKQWDDINEPPHGDDGEPEPGWERNVDAGRPGMGWDRFDYTEESYWRRPKPQVIGVYSSGIREQYEATPAKPRASVVEIVATGQPPTEDGGGSLIVPREVRINGVSVFTPRGTVVKIDDFRLGESLVTVHLSLVVRRLVIAADGDLNDEPQAGVPFMQAAKQHLGRPYDYNGPAPEEQP